MSSWAGAMSHVLLVCLQDVKKAIHADASIKWLDCSTIVNYEPSDEDVFMQPYYRYLV